MLGRDCTDCPFRVAGGLLPADLCGWPTVPALLWPWDWERGPCNLRRQLPERAASVVLARRWVTFAQNLAELRALAFRGVNLSQVCVVCQGDGLDVRKKESAPLWQRVCPACEGRGFHGPRDLHVVPEDCRLQPLEAPEKFRKFFEEHLSRASAGLA